MPPGGGTMGENRRGSPSPEGKRPSGPWVVVTSGHGPPELRRHRSQEGNFKGVPAWVISL